MRPVSVRAIILAGQRPGPDALCGHAGVDYKADIEIGGRSMLTRVTDALVEGGIGTPIMLVGYSKPRAEYDQIEGGEGPADSARLSLQTGTFPALLTTCDHALLTAEMVRDFVEGSVASGADFTVGLATKDCIERDHPETKRTYLTFRDEAVSGCNLFYIRNEEGRAAIDLWKRAQHLRKKPLRLALTIGPMIAVRYLLGRLTLSDAFDYASRKIGATAAPVLLDHAEAAIDVDKPCDLDLVKAIIARRESADG